MNLDEMNLDELRSLKRDVEKAIASFEERRRAEAMAAVEATAREHGLSLSDLMGKRKGRRPATVVASEAKYRNPEQTWSGRGCRPAWIGDRDLSELAVWPLNRQSRSALIPISAHSCYLFSSPCYQAKSLYLLLILLKR